MLEVQLGRLLRAQNDGVKARTAGLIAVLTEKTPGSI